MVHPYSFFAPSFMLLLCFIHPDRLANKLIAMTGQRIKGSGYRPLTPFT